MKKKRILWILTGILIFLAVSFLVYTQIYYHADDKALAALNSTDQVQVKRAGYGWYFDGPSDDQTMIFYPGAKVEETAYAPMLLSFAENGLDVCLVKMPFRLALFGVNKASDVMDEYDYEHWYIGGHSLGGSMAASYAADHSTELDGVILLASYPVKKLDDSLTEILLYGSDDLVLNMDRFQKAKAYSSAQCEEYVIDGGNHAGFGNYGEQKGDGEADISAARQQSETVRFVMEIIDH